MMSSVCKCFVVDVVFVNADGTDATFYIDGTSYGSCGSANMPTTADENPVGMRLRKTIGTTQRTVEVDYFWLNWIATTPR